MITFLSNQSILFQPTYFNDLNKFNKLKTQNEKTNKASELYSDLLQKYFDENYDLLDAERINWNTNINLKSYFLKHIIMMRGLKMKNFLINLLIKKI